MGSGIWLVRSQTTVGEVERQAFHTQASLRILGGIRSWFGVALIGIALIVYTAWPWAADHVYPYMPTFVTLFNIGILTFLLEPYPKALRTYNAT